jgi:hypothetical protein
MYEMSAFVKEWASIAFVVCFMKDMFRLSHLKLFLLNRKKLAEGLLTIRPDSKDQTSPLPAQGSLAYLPAHHLHQFRCYLL